ncbi:MAG: hypothetical protein RML37_03315 [Chitinophagales bacterium]|nr:hypothetical protein [Chitinophagales bacterium]
MYRTIYILFSIVVCYYTFGQTIQITIIPGSEYSLARRDEWKALVNNTTNQTLKVFFYGIAYEASRGKIFEIRSSAREILPGVTSFGTHYYVGLEPYTILYEDPELREYGIRTNTLPAGDYEMCIYAYSALDSLELGSTCYHFSADYFTPPVLVSPDNNETICEPYPFFNWLPPAPDKGQNFTYTLYLYEIQNKQSPWSAVQINPPFYERKGITTPIVQYGINARNLRPGYRYAWKVSAEINNKTVAVSEVWSFVYCDEKLFMSADTSSKKKNIGRNLPKPGIAYLELKDNPSNNFSVLDRGLLSFLYMHRSNTPSAAMQITDASGSVVHQQLLQVTPGDNYFSAPITNYKGLKTNELYQMQVIDANGNIQKLFFKIK